MDPAEDSFEVSPMNSKKYDENEEQKEPVAAAAKENGNSKSSRKISKKATENMTISGVSEFDYLGSEHDQEENQDSDLERENEKDNTRKSLEKEFIEAAEADAENELSNVKVPTFDDANDMDRSEVPQFTINPVEVYSKRQTLDNSIRPRQPSRTYSV